MALVALGLVGCASSLFDGRGFSRSDAINELHLFVSPVALKSNPSGIADGLAVRVFASSHRQAKGVSIRSGTLEIMAYDGAPDEAARLSLPPTKVWAFPATKLISFAVTSSLGTGYELALLWEGPRPSASRLTLVARYTPVVGSTILASPSIVPNALK